MSNEALALPTAATVGGSTPSGAGNFITYRPNYVGPDIPGTFTVWSDVMDALDEIGNGPRYLTFHDDDMPMSITIPAGTYDMTNVVWFMDFAVNLPVNPTNAVDVILADGVYFIQLAVIDGPINVVVQNTTAAVMRMGVPTSVNTPAFTFILKNFARLTVSGSQPFIEVDNSQMAILCDTFAGITSNNGVPMGGIRTINNGSIQLFIIGQGTNLPNNCITGDGSPGCGFLYYPLTHGALASFSVAVANYSGISNLQIQDSSRVARGVVNNSAPGVNNDNTDGHLIGTLWADISVSPVEVYVCADNTTGAAVWDLVGAQADNLEYHDAIVGGPTETHATIALAVADNKQRIAVLADVTESATISPIATNTIINIAPSVTVTYSAANVGAFINLASVVNGKFIIHGNGKILVQNAANRVLVTDTTGLDNSLEIRDLHLDFEAVTVSVVTLSNLERAVLRRCRITANGNLINQMNFSTVQKEIIIENCSIYNTVTAAGYPIRFTSMTAGSSLRVVGNAGVDAKSFNIQFATSVPTYITIVDNHIQDCALSGINPVTTENVLFNNNRCIGSFDWNTPGGNMSGVFSNNHIVGNMIIGNGLELLTHDLIVSDNKCEGLLTVTTLAATRVLIDNNTAGGDITLSSPTITNCGVSNNHSAGNITAISTTMTYSKVVNNNATSNIIAQTTSNSSYNLIENNTAAASLDCTMWGPVTNVDIKNNNIGGTFLFASNIGDITKCNVIGNSSVSAFNVTSIFDIIETNVVNNKSNSNLTVLSANRLADVTVSGNHIQNDFTIQGDLILNLLANGNYCMDGGAGLLVQVANGDMTNIQVTSNTFKALVDFNFTLAGQSVYGLVFSDNICSAGLTIGTAVNTVDIRNTVIKGNKFNNNITLHATNLIRNVNINSNNLVDPTMATYYDLVIPTGTTSNISLNGNVMNTITGGTAGSILAVGNVTNAAIVGNLALHASSVANI